MKTSYHNRTTGVTKTLETHNVDRRDSGCTSQPDEAAHRSKMAGLPSDTSSAVTGNARSVGQDSPGIHSNVPKESKGKGVSVPNSNGPAVGYVFGTTQPQAHRPRGGKGVSEPNTNTPPGADSAFSRGTGNRSKGKGTSTPNSNGPQGKL